LARDHTGSGKTLAFILPLLERMRKNEEGKSSKSLGPSTLIIAPTRELAIQSKEVIEKLQNDREELRLACLYGGKNMYEQK
jgi:superfamily II DNA/RNA helicase